MKRPLLTLTIVHRSKVMQLIMFSSLSHVYLGKWASCLCSYLYLCISATNSLSSGEVEAIAISCSVILVVVVIIVITLSACGFMFKRKQLLRSVTISSVHTSSADTGQQTSMSHAQNEVNACSYHFIQNNLLHRVVTCMLHMYMYIYIILV